MTPWAAQPQSETAPGARPPRCKSRAWFVNKMDHVGADFLRVQRQDRRTPERRRRADPTARAPKTTEGVIDLVKMSATSRSTPVSEIPACGYSRAMADEARKRHDVCRKGRRANETLVEKYLSGET